MKRYITFLLFLSLIIHAMDGPSQSVESMEQELRRLHAEIAQLKADRMANLQVLRFHEQLIRKEKEEAEKKHWLAIPADVSDSPFVAAAKRGDMHYVQKVLKEVGGPDTLKTKDGVTALMMAAASNNEPLTKLLLDAGSIYFLKDAHQISAEDYAAGKPGIMALFERAEKFYRASWEYTYHNHGDIRDIEKYLKEGTLPNAIALIEAVKDQKNDLIALFLKYGTNPNVPNENGEVPLLSVKNAESTALLLEHGANPNVDYYGNVPLMRIIKNKKTMPGKNSTPTMKKKKLSIYFCNITQIPTL